MAQVHAPAAQLSPGLHCVLQLPQAEVAVIVLTQASLQQLCPVTQATPATPH
jgi:hypothetical protein